MEGKGGREGWGGVGVDLTLRREEAADGMRSGVGVFSSVRGDWSSQPAPPPQAAPLPSEYFKYTSTCTPRAASTVTPWPAGCDYWKNGGNRIFREQVAFKVTKCDDTTGKNEENGRCGGPKMRYYLSTEEPDPCGEAAKIATGASCPEFTGTGYETDVAGLTVLTIDIETNSNTGHTVIWQVAADWMLCNPLGGCDQTLVDISRSGVRYIEEQDDVTNPSKGESRTNHRIFFHNMPRNDPGAAPHYYDKQYFDHENYQVQYGVSRASLYREPAITFEIEDSSSVCAEPPSPPPPPPPPPPNRLA